jgi:hypothetical protein
MVAAAVALAVMASAQTAREGAALVLPIASVPLSVETTEEYVTKNLDGTSTRSLSE